MLSFWLLATTVLHEFQYSVECGISCPHEAEGLQRWSTWAGKPKQGENVRITTPTLMDMSPPELYNLTIENGGQLTFDPAVEIELRVANIYIRDGRLDIGSETCLYTGDLTITLTGTRSSHAGESDAKVILVNSGGTLEIHGSKKLAWTKLDGTVTRPELTGDIKFDHKTSENKDVKTSTKGIVAYTFTIDNNGNPQVKQFGVYDLVKEGEALVNHIENVNDGEILTMAVQQRLKITKKGQHEMVYDALEVLLYGSVTNSAVLRTVPDDGTTWVLFYEKGNPQSLLEDTNPKLSGSKVRFDKSKDLIFTVETEGGTKQNHQTVNIRIETLNAINPLINVIDDVTTWLPGDNVVLSSTDYDWEQAEVKTVVMCVDCANNQIRIDSPLRYTHFGRMINHAVDTRGEVALLTRNVVIQGEMEDDCPRGNGNCDDEFVKGIDTFGAHIKVLQGYANVHIEGAEIRFAGQQTDLGRYPIHFHVALEPIPTASQPYIRENSVHDTFARCTTIHGSHNIHVIDNVCYNSMGHGYFLEDGGEQFNILDGNIVISTKKASGKLEPMDYIKPASFWITNPNNTVINNVAAGGEGAGIWYIFPEEPLPPSRQFKITGYREARRTKLLEFYNNVAHSNTNTGVMFGFRLQDDRTQHFGNKWQPLENPKDENSTAIDQPIERFTAFKNVLQNAWIEGGRLNVSKISVADSLNGIAVTNEGLGNEYSGRLFDSVVMGDTENIGEPLFQDGIQYPRSFPRKRTKEEPRSGVTMWKGPVKYHNIWFDGFDRPDYYNFDIGAIAKRRTSPYFFSMTNTFTDVQFAFDDGPGLGTRAISGVEGVDPGWDNKDGELIAGFTYIEGSTKYYVVKPDHFSAAADDCKIRENWRLAICNTKYGNLKVHGEFENILGVVFVRDDLPSAQLRFELDKNTGPQVVFDGSRTYTVHFEKAIPDTVKVTADGMEIGDTLRVGICTPVGATLNIHKYHPFRVKMNDFVQVQSLEELDATDENDGKKLFIDSSTGMVYYKFINDKNRGWDERNTCANGKCPDIRIEVLSGKKKDSDCRERLYGDAVNKKMPPIPVKRDVMPANGAKTPPEGWGHGKTYPFTDKEPIDGGWSDYTEWSACSKTCGDGQQARFRKCDTPIPRHGGQTCSGTRVETQACNLGSC